MAVDRERIEAAIATKVPRPSPEEYKEIARDVCKSIGWDWLSARFKEALKDETEQWQVARSSLARALGQRPAIHCRYCSAVIVDAHPLGFIFDGVPGYVCNKCLLSAIHLLEERTAAQVVDKAVAAETDCRHHAAGDRSASETPPTPILYPLPLKL